MRCWSALWHPTYWFVQSPPNIEQLARSHLISNYPDEPLILRLTILISLYACSQGYDVAKLCLLLSLVNGVDAAQSARSRGCVFARGAINVCLTGTHKEAIKNLLESVAKVRPAVEGRR